MTDRPHRGAIDYEQLGRYFRALSVPARVLLLHKLQVPQAPTEISLPPFRKDPGRRADRTISRQAVEGHLKTLEMAGLVRSRAGTREGQPVREYVVDQPRLFVAVDEMRRLSLIQLGAGGEPLRSAVGGTVEGDRPKAPPALPKGPSLALVSGPREGDCFALEGGGPWTLGRSRTSHVTLDYDPFVSSANTEVWRSGDRFFVRSLPTSRNGTTLNWRLLQRGEDAPLVPGDTIGAGRSLLVFRLAQA